MYTIKKGCGCSQKIESRSEEIMKYKTIDEWEHYNFSEAVIGDIQTASGFFHLILDNVTILSDNSCNRDIRDMRANDFMLKIIDSEITMLIQEGYKVLDANGNLMQKYEDTEIEAEDFADVIKELVEGTIYQAQKKESEYEFIIDTEEHTYVLTITGTSDEEEWDRFLNK